MLTFVPPAEVLYAANLADDSPVRTLTFRRDHVLFRPYSPRGSTASGLWLERNPNHPKIWGWLLAVARDVSATHPSLVPGVQLVVARAQGEVIAKETPARVRYFGHVHAVIALPLEAIQVAIDPPLVQMEGPRASD